MIQACKFVFKNDFIILLTGYDKKKTYNKSVLFSNSEHKIQGRRCRITDETVYKMQYSVKTLKENA